MNIEQSLQLNHRPTFLYTYLKPAFKAGLIEITQPDTPKSPTQKYRLTAKGWGFFKQGINIKHGANIKKSDRRTEKGQEQKNY